jgi:nucleoside-diphosphate-sugar epimerase
MRVLVDGDRGYIGAILVPLVQAAGHEVVGLDVGWYDGCDFGAQPAGYEQRTQDIRDVSPGDLEGFDAVIHLAAISNDPIGHLNPDATYGVNARGAIHIG